MQIDADLLADLGQRKKGILHLYDWEGDSATYGHFVAPPTYLNMEGVKKRRLNLGRRPTGGGIVFHVWDLAFSVLVPATHPAFSMNTLENYAFVNGAVLAAVQGLLGEELKIIPEDGEQYDPLCQNFCMAKPTKYDVVLGGRKVAGAAQRKTKEGFLHQGTIALVMPPDDYLDDVLLPETRVKEAMQAFTYPLLGNRMAEFKEAKMELKELLKNTICKVSR